MYSEIYNFCKIRNLGNIYKNSEDSPPPRVMFLIDLLEREGISFAIDKFYSKGWSKKEVVGYNIILKGDSSKMVVAHHDISNPDIDNANDNSASVINAIMVKKILPEINVVLLDGEECAGLGSQRLSEQIKLGELGQIDWVLNLELTGRGGKHFFIGEFPGQLQTHIKSLFDCPVVSTPFNDSVVFTRNGIDSCVINPLPPLLEGTSHVKWNDETYLDFSLLYNCHSYRDTLDTISVEDMKDFVEEVLVKILN